MTDLRNSSHWKAFSLYSAVQTIFPVSEGIAATRPSPVSSVLPTAAERQAATLYISPTFVFIHHICQSSDTASKISVSSLSAPGTASWYYVNPPFPNVTASRATFLPPGTTSLRPKVPTGLGPKIMEACARWPLFVGLVILVSFHYLY